MKPRLLDLFCGEGGAGHGYVLAGFDVFGVDITPKPRYPYPFHLGDALEVLDNPEFMAGFDVIHASPPCKSENPLRHLHDTEHPDLLTPTLAKLRAQDKPWVVENVPGTDKLPGALTLCGGSFGLGAQCRDGKWRPLRRHRLFQSSGFLMGNGCSCTAEQPVGVYGNGGGGSFVRGYKGTLAESLEAIGAPWMSRAGVSQAIPPAYTRFIGEQILAAL
jgi:DNA (cytosine-5)-methyltransferase 1